MLILGLKGLRFEQWLIVGGFSAGEFTTMTTTTITIIYLTTLSSKSTSARSKYECALNLQL